jgi:hypothetical protein
MRIDVKKTKVYPFEELTDDAQDKAIEALWNLNVDHEWWEFIFEDAANVGIKLSEFGIGRASFCRGDFIEAAEDVATLIVENHGRDCGTWYMANEFLAEFEQGKKGHEAENGYDPDYGLFVESDYYLDIAAEFERFILEDYRTVLQKKYEYLTSREVIVKTIKANEYEFIENGKLYCRGSK